MNRVDLYISTLNSENTKKCYRRDIIAMLDFVDKKEEDINIADKRLNMIMDNTTKSLFKLLNDDYNEPLIINSGFSVRENGKYVNPLDGYLKK